jgi:ParB family transcriptional regulator, chromosome partitioning protein
MKIQMISLNQLVPSALNVRKTGAKTEIKALAASIKAHGLLQNLQVKAASDDKFEVVAGGRRLAALLLLVKQKAVKPSDKFPCHVLDTEDAQEISLAENTLRLPMHPADQFEAFRALTDAGKGPEEIAARFGTSAATVRQRLKLASVSPRLFALYRKDGMSLDQLMAFTISDDHKAQEAVWFDAPEYQRNASNIRRALTAAHVEADDARVQFVGIDAYQKAGGCILRDLFLTDHDGYLTDAALLDKLVTAKLERKAKKLRAEGWKWVDIMPKLDHETLRAYGRAHPEHQPLTEEQHKALDEVTAEYDALAEQAGDEYDDEMSDRLDALSEKIEELSEGEPVWQPETLAQSGAILTLSRSGELRIERGLIKPEDKKAFASASKEQVETSGDNTATPNEPASPYSAALVEDLTAQRTAALRAMLKDNCGVALAAVAHALAMPLFYGASAVAQSCIDIDIENRDLRRSAESIAASRAYEAIEVAWGTWKEQLPFEETALFGWLLTQEQATVTNLIAFCAAMSVDAVRGKSDWSHAPRLAHADELAQALGLDMTAWWTPTKDSFLRRVPKKLVLEAVTEGVSAQAAENLASLKKEALADSAEQRLAGTGWLPVFLRSPEKLAA